MESSKDIQKEIPKEAGKDAPKEVAKTPKSSEKKYLVIKNFTADKQYYRGNYFVSKDEKLVSQLLNSKLIK